MEYFQCVMFWSGVVLWIVCIMAALMVFGERAGLNIPSIAKEKNFTLYNFGIGQYVVLRDEEMVMRMMECGFSVHRANGYWWALRIFRTRM